MPPLPKGKTRKQIKAKRDRLEARIKREVRAKVEERDEYECRLFWCLNLEMCCGKAEWAHLGEWKRFKTRGLPPEERHCTRGSLMLCERHHREYDAGEIIIEYGELGADGSLTVYRKAA